MAKDKDGQIDSGELGLSWIQDIGMEQSWSVAENSRSPIRRNEEIYLKKDKDASCGLRRVP